jgi:hypothetical protein
MSDRIIVIGIMIVRAGSVTGGQGESGLKYLNPIIVFGVNATLSTFVVSQRIVFEGG